MIDKLYLQSTAYLLSKELPFSIVKNIQNHPYNDLTDVVFKLINEELESWQYCYIQQGIENKSVPEYIINSVSNDVIESIAKELIDLNSPLIEESTPHSRDKRLVEVTGGREEYCEQQIEWYTESCVRTLTPTIIDKLESYSDETFERKEIDPIAEELVLEFGLWRWYILTKDSKVDTDPENVSEVVNNRVLKELSDSFIQSIKQHNLDKDVDLEQLQRSL